ncbi:hypothetical protein SeMB42_g04694 [Synchytrium endobioticum]|uniref:V-type proton ATPase subunit S1/VOA1 transmembrane domain-containing protein n=1 Tax=Synchytrium endobioticum TaxID=286115 RepID=A0A507CZ83_9FUNG|nr:hypothetical protein SeMB42_g04694 [Synchytrium endobioticum]TPX44378.1 hypothetical protein SeLEV6574_g04533 [Synchytrium endobioticum]
MKWIKQPLIAIVILLQVCSAFQNTYSLQGRSSNKIIERNVIIFDSLEALPCHDLTVIVPVQQMIKLKPSPAPTSLYIPYTSGDLASTIQSKCGLATIHYQPDEQKDWEVSTSSSLFILNNVTSLNEESVNELLDRMGKANTDYILYLIGPTRAGSPQATAIGRNWNRLPISQKYVFFTAGSFAGLAVLVVLIAALLGAYTILASIETPSKYPTPDKSK